MTESTLYYSKMKFREMVRRRRKEKGLKVCELAQKVGVNPVYITQIEKHGKLPSWKVMKLLSNVLGELTKPYVIEKYPELMAEGLLNV